MYPRNLFYLTLATLSAVVFTSCGGTNDERASESQSASETAEQGLRVSPESFRDSVARGDYKTLDLLLEAGHDISALDNDGAPALFYAPDVETAQFLVEHGADVDQESDAGLTTLWLAVENGRTAVAKFLLENGANPNAADDHGVTALMRAAATGNKELVTLLLDHGAYTDLKDDQHRTPGFLASMAGRNDILELLINRPNPKSLQSDGDPVDYAEYGYPDREAFDATWKRFFTFNDVPADEALSMLCDAAGLEARGLQAVNEQLDRSIRLNLSGVSPVEALERFCEEIGVHPEYEESDNAADSSEVWLRQGPRRWPAAFAGPFLVAVDSYLWREPMLRLQVCAFALDNASTAEEQEDFLYVAEVVDADGNNLVTSREAAEKESMFGKDPRGLVMETEVGLAESVADGATVVTIRGKINAALLTKVDTGRLDDIRVDARVRAAEMDFVLTEVTGMDPGQSPQLEFRVEGASKTFGKDTYAIRCYDADGNRLQNMASGFVRAMEEDPIVTVNLRETPAALEIDVITGLGKVEYPFEMQDIELVANPAP